MVVRFVAHYFMTRILDKLKREYSTEYFLNNELVKQYSKPKIYPKIVTSRSLSDFTRTEKAEILKKYKRWYVYYSYRNPVTGRMERQDPIYMNVNRSFPDFDDRLKHIKRIQKMVDNLLKEGFSPFENEVNAKMYTVKSAFKFALDIKKSSLKETSYRDYKNRLAQFEKFLEKKGLLNSSITDVSKKDVNTFLNKVLKETSARSRNNSMTVVSAIFSVLAENDIIKSNFVKTIKWLKTNPKKNKAFTEDEINNIFAKLKSDNLNLYSFCSHVYYGLFRPIEVIRITVGDIDFNKKLVKSDTKTGHYFKQIPNILFDEFYANLQHSKYNPGYLLFTRLGTPGEWNIREESRRDYFGDKFRDIIKKPMGFSSDYTIYSFRHSAIGKLFIEKIKELKKQGVFDFEDKALDFIRKITDHKDNNTTRTYLREIGYYKIDDWSDLM